MPYNEFLGDRIRQLLHDKSANFFEKKCSEAYALW